METSKWHVLVVEDEYDSIQMVSKILRHHGATVTVARSGNQGLELLKTFTPTFVIMDLALPEMDGWQTLEAIRQDDRHAHLPVIAITAYHSPNVAEDAYEAGFDAYFPKPLDTNQLINQLGKILASQ